MTRLPTFIGAAVVGLVMAGSAAAATQDQYEGLGHAESMAALNANFPQVLRADPDPPMPQAVGRVLGYPGPSVAAVETGGRRGLLLSTAPLAVAGADGRFRAMDLDLRDRGRWWAPGRSSVSLAIDPRDGGFTIGPREGASTIRVLPLDGDPDAEPDASLIEGKGLVTNSREDSDTLLRATETGLETYEVIRGPQAPTRIRWRLDLPGGVRALRSPAGFVFRDAADLTLLTVRAPWALDAAGKEIPIGLRYADGVLELIVHHDAPDTAYPVLADPTWDAHYDFTQDTTGSQGFFELDEPEDTPGYELSLDDSGFGAGLFVYPRGGGEYPNPPDGEEVRGSIFFRAPGTTRLKQAVWRGVRYRLEQRSCGPPASFANVRQYLRFTLSLAGDASDDRQFGPDGTHDDLTEVAGRTITLTDPAAVPGGTNASMAMWTDVTGATVPFIATNPGTSGCRDGLIDPYASAERVDLVLTDVEAPTVDEVSGPLIDFASDLDAAWLGSEEVTAGVPVTGKIRAKDPGSGISDVVLRARNPATGSVREFRQHDDGERCDDTHSTPAQQGRICPEIDLWTLTAASPLPLEALGVEEGRWDLQVTTTDRTGQQGTSGTWSAYVDTTAPAVGTLSVKTPPETADQTGRWIRANQPDEDLDIAITATDPPSRSPGGAATGTLSGVRRYALDITPSGISTESLIPRLGVAEEQCGPPSATPFGPISAPCPSTGPTQTATIARDLPEGETLVTGAATDHAGNRGETRRTSVWVDNSRPGLAGSGTIADLDDTWVAPTGTLELDIAARDPDGSGVANVTTHVQDETGTNLEPVNERDTCPSPSVGAAPTPVCSPAADERLVLAAADLPEGEVRVLADAGDAVGNRTAAGRGRLEYRLHVDRTPPKVRLAGEVADLADAATWANPGDTVSATVIGTDVGAGIKTLELWARDDNGERRIASRDVCQPTEPAVGATPPCPLRAQASFDVPVSQLSDGSVRIEARAIEFTGRLARVRDTVFLDTTAPAPPRQVTVRRVMGSMATVSWERPPPPPDQSGISGYQYAVVYAGQTEVVWNTTPYQGVQISGLPAGVDFAVLVETIDGVGLTSDPAAGVSPVATAAAVAHSAQEIYVREGLKQLEDYANAAGRRLVIPAAATASGGVFAGKLRVVRKFLVRGTIIGTIIGYLTGDGDLSCEQGPIMRQAFRANIDTGRAFLAVATAGRANLERLLGQVDGARNLQRKLAQQARHNIDVLDKECQPPSKTARATSSKIRPALDDARRYVQDLDDEEKRREGLLDAREINKRRPTVGTNRCGAEARKLVDRLSGAGKPRYVVYWAPPAPPPELVRYVGISRALDSRCAKHKKSIRDDLVTLDLPPLYRREAKNVEEALISHFGPANEPANSGSGVLGQLTNIYHAIDPGRKTPIAGIYCPRLTLGQQLLRTNGYTRYDSALFTRGVRCPGVN